MKLENPENQDGRVRFILDESMFIQVIDELRSATSLEDYEALLENLALPEELSGDLVNLRAVYQQVCADQVYRFTGQMLQSDLAKDDTIHQIIDPKKRKLAQKDQLKEAKTTLKGLILARMKANDLEDWNNFVVTFLNCPFAEVPDPEVIELYRKVVSIVDTRNYSIARNIEQQVLGFASHELVSQAKIQAAYKGAQAQEAKFIEEEEPILLKRKEELQELIQRADDLNDLRAWINDVRVFLGAPLVSNPDARLIDAYVDLHQIMEESGCFMKLYEASVPFPLFPNRTLAKDVAKCLQKLKLLEATNKERVLPALRAGGIMQSIEAELDRKLYMVNRVDIQAEGMRAYVDNYERLNAKKLRLLEMIRAHSMECIELVKAKASQPILKPDPIEEDLGVIAPESTGVVVPFPDKSNIKKHPQAVSV